MFSHSRYSFYILIHFIIIPSNMECGRQYLKKHSLVIIRYYYNYPYFYVLFLTYLYILYLSYLYKRVQINTLIYCKTCTHTHTYMQEKKKAQKVL